MSRPRISPGPFLAYQIREGDPYELSHGHAIRCSPSGPTHGGPNLSGGQVLDTDPDVEWTGIDVGYSPDPGTLWSIDIALGAPPKEERGWATEAPRLAVEYAGTGQDESELQKKIEDLFAGGTELVWVVRLLGPRRVEVYAPDKPVEVQSGDDKLTAPGILRNPVPVRALYDRDAAHEAVLRNLLQRHGYEDLDAVRKEGIDEGKLIAIGENILTILENRDLEVDDETRRSISSCRDLETLRRWLIRSTSVGSAADVFTEP
jgi:Uma2 family endonuclease